MGERRSKHLVLILARELASNLATPTLIANAQGQLVFYNEAAEEVLGGPFAEASEMPIDEWTALARGHFKGDVVFGEDLLTLTI